MLGRRPLTIPDAAETLPGRDEPMSVPAAHHVNGRPMVPPFPYGVETILVAMGCFWGAERTFWEMPGVWTTAVGYAGGYTPNPTYEEVCTGMTGHTEAVLVAWAAAEAPLADVLRLFWENHDPTQGMRQGNDIGTQYRSGLYVTDGQRGVAEASRDAYAVRLAEVGFGEVTTEVVDRPELFYAEDYHQQYLAKNPMGYCGIGGTGVSCPAGELG